MGRGDEYVRQFMLVRALSDLGRDAHRYNTSSPRPAKIIADAAASGGDSRKVERRKPRTTQPQKVEEGVPPTAAAYRTLEIVAPPTDKRLRADIDKMARYVLKHGGAGGEFERLAMRKQKNNARFGFLFGGEGAQYYKSQLLLRQS